MFLILPGGGGGGGGTCIPSLQCEFPPPTTTSVWLLKNTEELYTVLIHWQNIKENKWINLIVLQN